MIVAALVVGVPAKVDDAWTEFKTPGGVAEEGSSRFQSFSGNNRYQYWEAAVEQNATRPLTGRGSGTFEYWTNRSTETSGFVRDAHSLYLETLGELGIVGLVLLVSFFGIVVGGGIWRTLNVVASPKIPDGSRAGRMHGLRGRRCGRLDMGAQCCAGGLPPARLGSGDLRRLGRPAGRSANGLAREDRGRRNGPSRDRADLDSGRIDFAGPGKPAGCGVG